MICALFFPLLIITGENCGVILSIYIYLLTVAIGVNPFSHFKLCVIEGKQGRGN